MPALSNSPSLSVLRMAAYLAVAVSLAATGAGAAEISFVEGTVDAKGIKGYKRCAEFEFKPFTANKSGIIGVWSHPRSDGEIRISVERNEVKAYFSGAYIDGSMDEANIVVNDLHLRFDITHEYGGCELSMILPGVIAGDEPKVAAAAPKAGTPPIAEDMARDLATWQGVQNSTRAADFEGYIAAFPKGLFVELAGARIKALGAEQATRLAVQQEDQRSEQARRERNLAALTRPGQDALEGINFGDYHALIIGINEYRNLPNLKSAVNDAKAMAAVLGEQYGFKVTLLIDPTRGDIIDAFDEYRESLRFKDNPLIYYAGHGWLDQESDDGYWLPVDAKPNRRSNWVSNATLTSTLKAIAAKHVMVLADSCYSGRLVRAAKVNLEVAGAPDYFRKMSQKMARVVMTSGGLEPVADSAGGDHSPFARALLKALAENQSILEGSGLFNAVRRPVLAVADQTPEYSDVRQAGHDGGDFLFVRR